MIDSRALGILHAVAKPREYATLLDEYKERGFGLAYFGQQFGSVGILSCGFGDGTYPINELVDKSGSVCGIEIVFLDSNVLYPFQVQPAQPVPSPEQIADEEFHWQHIEHLWDPVWSSMRESPAAAEAFFEGLTPGERALSSLDIFDKIVLRFGLRGIFQSAWYRVVAKEVGKAYELLGAKEYAKRSEKILALAPREEEAKLFDLDAEKWREFMTRHEQDFSEFETWFAEEMKGNENRIEILIRRYVESHRDEFRRG